MARPLDRSTRTVLWTWTVAALILAAASVAGLVLAAFVDRAFLSMSGGTGYAALWVGGMALVMWRVVRRG